MSLYYFCDHENLFLFVFLVPLIVLASAVSFLVGVEGVGAGAEGGGVSDFSAT